MRNVLVIGGSRYFGRHLVTLLRDAGTRVTLLNRGSAPAPDGVTPLIADRADHAALTAALGSSEFDAVIDQVCSTPAHAAVARRVFANRTGRYVMTSTIEVYDPATSDLLASDPLASDLLRAPDPTRRVPLAESQVLPARWPVDPERLAAADTPELRYAEGKRQAEAVFTQDAPFAFAAVRSAHVLGGGALDFTGRLAHYTERIAAGRPITVHREPFATSFVHHREIAEFLAWAASADFTGPVNACSNGTLDVTELSELVADRIGGPAVRYRIADAPPPHPDEPGHPDDKPSPFSFDRWYPMDNTRATELGFRFRAVRDWLPEAVDEALTTSKAGV
ncbi:NAD-dependent epimerase/dehydratase family protein [Kitasatospora aureofaciens]|uniref:NAD-dependent epimerase/dehydratase family protein n=1 Tax=Kitasatospora aureofaciens TaxID=1894 RepID=UPI001C46DED5|nr:NAD-dependent epimerase/dehydratase family protein [Kitasatospora aureofaciens]MBV6699727.1 NAD-dependent epimerase/dehydratase family protein [Kitasatospora aureofaciens]